MYVMKIKTIEDLEFFIQTMIHHPAYKDLKDELDMIYCQPELHEHQTEIEDLEELWETDPDLAEQLSTRPIEDKNYCEHDKTIITKIKMSLEFCNQILNKYDKH